MKKYHLSLVVLTGSGKVTSLDAHTPELALEFEAGEVVTSLSCGRGHSAFVVENDGKGWEALSSKRDFEIRLSLQNALAVIS